MKSDEGTTNFVVNLEKVFTHQLAEVSFRLLNCFKSRAHFEATKCHQIDKFCSASVDSVVFIEQLF